MLLPTPTRQSRRKGLRPGPSHPTPTHPFLSQAWNADKTNQRWWNSFVLRTSTLEDPYLALSKSFTGVIKSSMGISSWLAFSSRLILFFKRSFAAWSFLGSTFFFFLRGSALMEKQTLDIFLFRLRNMLRHGTRWSALNLYWALHWGRNYAGV